MIGAQSSTGSVIRCSFSKIMLDDTNIMDDDEETELLKRIIPLIEFKDDHSVSQQGLSDLLKYIKKYHQEGRLSGDWPTTFSQALLLMRKTGIV